MDYKDAFVLLYHRVLPSEGSLAVSLAIFEKQIKFLVEAGYQFIDQEMLELLFSGGLDPEKKYVLLSFDDGWADNLFFASPILEKYSAKAMIAVSVSLMNNSDTLRNADEYKISDAKDAMAAAAYGEDASQFLSIPELRKMKESKIWFFASHACAHFRHYSALRKIIGFYPEKQHWTMKHALGGEIFNGAPRADFRSDLSEPRKILAPELIAILKKAKNKHERMKICKEFENPIQTVESMDEFRQRVKEDLSRSKEYLNEKLDVKINSLVWPSGHYSDESIEIALECGFEFLFTCERGKIDSSVKPSEIPRITVPNSLFRLKRRIKHGIFRFL